MIVLACNSRLEVTVTILALYLGLLDGPVKLLSEGHELATAFRDVLIFAVSLGALARLVMKRERIRLPPLSGWVILFVVLVLAEAFNPHTHGILKALGEKYGLHPLALEDVVNIGQRPKVEPYDQHLFIIADMVYEL